MLTALRKASNGTGSGGAMNDQEYNLIQAAGTAIRRPTESWCSGTRSGCLRRMPHAGTGGGGGAGRHSPRGRDCPFSGGIPPLPHGSIWLTLKPPCGSFCGRKTAIPGTVPGRRDRQRRGAGPPPRRRRWTQQEVRSCTPNNVYLGLGADGLGAAAITGIFAERGGTFLSSAASNKTERGL